MRMRRAKGLSGARSGFGDGVASLAHGAGVGLMGLNFEGGEGGAGDAEIGRASAAIDDGTGGDGDGSGGAHDFDDFHGAAAGGDDVFDDDYAFAGSESEAAAEGHFAIGVAFGEEEADAEGTGDFVADDEAAEGGGDDEIYGIGADEGFQLIGQGAAEGFGVPGMREHESGLKVGGAMESAGETEVALEVGAGLPEEVEDVGIGGHCKGLI